MAKLQFIHPVEYAGKAQYTIDTDVMPMPDGSGLLFRSSAVLTQDGLIPTTMVPWMNIASMSADVPQSFFDPPESGPDEVS